MDAEVSRGPLSELILGLGESYQLSRPGLLIAAGGWIVQPQPEGHYQIRFRHKCPEWRAASEAEISGVGGLALLMASCHRNAAITGMVLRSAKAMTCSPFDWLQPGPPTINTGRSARFSIETN
jgi:hypothetical protein